VKHVTIGAENATNARKIVETHAKDPAFPINVMAIHANRMAFTPKVMTITAKLMAFTEIM